MHLGLLVEWFRMRVPCKRDVPGFILASCLCHNIKVSFWQIGQIYGVISTRDSTIYIFCIFIHIALLWSQSSNNQSNYSRNRDEAEHQLDCHNSFTSVRLMTHQLQHGQAVCHLLNSSLRYPLSCRSNTLSLQYVHYIEKSFSSLN